MDEASIRESLSDGNIVDLSDIHKSDKYPKEQTVSANYIHANDDEDDSSVMITFDTYSMSNFVVFLTFVASISGFMFGYDTGYISTALISINKDLSNKELSYGDKELITSATSLGALITAIFAGTFADIYGRKKSIMFSNFLFIIGAVLQVTSHTIWQMIIGRLIMGFGVGIGSLISPLFISEIAPKNVRGRLTVINSLWLTGGQLIAYGIGAGLHHVNNGWRIMVGLSMIPAVIQFFMFVSLPDTPRYYCMNNDAEAAKRVLKKSYVNATDEVIDVKIKNLMELNNSIHGKTVWHKVYNTVKELHSIPSNFRALIIACALQGIQQFTGWNALMYFSGTIFESVGIKNSATVSIIIAGTNFIFTAVAFMVIDKVGRRLILLIGIPLMSLFLVICAISFHYIDLKFEGNDIIAGNGGFSAPGIIVIISMIGFAASYAVGIGTVPWQQSELFPQNVRGVGTSFSTATNWAGSLVISSCFLTMLKSITPSGTFGLFAALAVVSFFFVYKCYPELSGLELEEVQLVLTDGFKIKQSQELAKKRKSEHLKQKKLLQLMEFNNTQLDPMDSSLLEDISDDSNKKLKNKSSIQLRTVDQEYRSQQEQLGNNIASTSTGANGNDNENHVTSTEYRVSTFQGETVLSDTEEE
ncbi:hypothetical protein QEN19_000194 [Hanseniaspora menglaensis]